jgi:hypothetical protein
MVLPDGVFRTEPVQDILKREAAGVSGQAWRSSRLPSRALQNHSSSIG